MSVNPSAFALSESAVHLWMATVDEALEHGLMGAYGALLSPAESAQADRFAFERDRRRYLLTRALVRSVLSRYAQGRRAPVDWAFAANEYGWPHLSNPLEGMPSVVFNLSHTHGTVVLAMREKLAVGIDVETWDRRINLDIADHFFSPMEVSALRRLPEAAQRERFMELWTLKESYIKARRMGLSIPLDQFGFDMEAEGRATLVLSERLLEADTPAQWDFFQFRPDAQHVVAVCAERTPHSTGMASVRVRRVVPLSPIPPVEMGCAVTRASAP